MTGDFNVTPSNCMPRELFKKVGVRDPRTGYFVPGCGGLDWAWTPEETSSVAAAVAAATRGSKNPKNQKIDDFGPKSMKSRFDRLCQGPKIDFLSFGTSKNPQNPENPRKKPENPENPDFWFLVPHSYPLRGGVWYKTEAEKLAESNRKS